jgi:hypothetical protein
MADTDVQIKFDAPAVLRKWPSRNYDHLYEIHTAPQGELVIGCFVPRANC